MMTLNADALDKEIMERLRGWYNIQVRALNNHHDDIAREARGAYFGIMDLLKFVESKKEDMEVVPVVRCSQCKYFMKGETGGRCITKARGTSDNWYCADGKKVTE